MSPVEWGCRALWLWGRGAGKIADSEHPFWTGDLTSSDPHIPPAELLPRADVETEAQGGRVARFALLKRQSRDLAPSVPQAPCSVPLVSGPRSRTCQLLLISESCKTSAQLGSHISPLSAGSRLIRSRSRARYFLEGWGSGRGSGLLGVGA